MKRLLFLAVCALAAGTLATSCKLSELELDGTTWQVHRCEDLFNGKVVNLFWEDEDEIVEINGYGDNIQVTITDPGSIYGPSTYGPEDVRIISCTASELVFDLFYAEYEDLDVDDCDYLLTYKGTKIYTHPYIYYGKEELMYVYFKPNGVAVDVGCYNYEGEDDIWWDSTRYHCKRVRL